MDVSVQKSNLRISKILISFAWFIEIFAVMTGLAISVMVGIDTYEKNVAITGDGEAVTNYTNVVIAALPFLMVSIVELAKIPVAQAVYATRQIVWRTLFFLMLAFLAGITFETALNGFERNYNNLNYQVSVVREKLERVDVRESVVLEKIEKAKSLTRETVIAEFDRQNQIYLTNREAEFEALTVATSLANTNSATQALQNEIDSLKQRLDKLSEEHAVRIGNLESELKIEINSSKNAISLSQETMKEEAENRREVYRQEVEKVEKSVEAARRALERAKIASEKAINEASIFSINRVRTDEGKKLASAESALEAEKKKLDKALERLRNFKSDDIVQDNLAAASGAVNKIIDKFDSRRRSLEEEYEQKASRIENSIAVKSDKLLEIIGLDKADIERERVRLNDERARIQSNYEGNLEKISVERDKQLVVVEKKEAAIQEYEQELSDIADSRAELKSQINAEASDNQIYRIAMMFAPDAATPADVPRGTVDMVGKIWFSSLAMVIAITGILLALASQVVKDPKQTNAKGRSSLSSTFRRLIIDIRKSVRKPKVIEKTIEKEVEKVVTVTKEVPVDKVVIKEVPVEIIKKEIVHVPVYSDDPDLIKNG